MQPPRRRAHACLLPSLLSASLLGLLGCASPGPPRPPSLQIPQPVSDLMATRIGEGVVLRFTMPARTTDGLPLRPATVLGSLCRQLAGDGPCLPVDSTETRAPLAVTAAGPAPAVVWTDVLPPALHSGAPRPIAYRVELRSAAGRSAGFSDPVYAAAGAAPPPVRDLRAEPMRLGIALRWQPVPGAGEILLHRTEPATAGSTNSTNATNSTVQTSTPGAPTHPKKEAKIAVPRVKSAAKQSSIPGFTTLQAAPGDPSAVATLDAGIAEGVPYTYAAVRRVQVQLGGHRLELQSALSAPVTVTWRDVYPPAAPTGLAALGYTLPSKELPKSPLKEEAGAFAIDLVWQPVNDPRLAGYLVYRQTLNGTGEPVGPRVKLTAEPMVTPGFHDATAKAAERYRYSVSTIDPKGNESGAVETVVEPAGR